MIKHTLFSVGMAICLPMLLAVPAIAWMTDWHWNPAAQSNGLGFYYFLTQTVSNRFGILTAMLLLGALMWQLKLGRVLAWKCALLILAPIVLGQITVSALKQVVQEPRPYIQWLNHNQPEAIQHFYHQTQAQRSAAVSDMLKDDTALPVWQKEHWVKEATWSFPSGHAVFAAAWALLGAGVLWPRKRFFATLVLVAWAVGVLLSRLVLGMHWSVDLLISTVLAFILTTPSVLLINRDLPPQAET